MSKGQTLLGMGIGALLMYALDPGRGNRRRAIVRDKVIHAANKTADAADATARDLANRTCGLFAEARSRLRPEDAPNEVLVARVRSKMGRVVSHPRAIEVAADGGRVTLRGPVLDREVKDLLRAVASVRGVSEVDNQLDVHETAENIPSLQGGGSRPGLQFELAETNWAPAARFLVGTTGGALVAYGTRRRGPLGLSLGTAGLGLLARALTNLEMKRLLGIGGGRRAVDVQKTIHIAAPVEEVFAFWDNYENFPHFMRNVREVRDRGNGRSHWVVAGPAGSRFEWEAEVTKRIPNEVLAWKTVSGGMVPNAGIIRFSPENDGTRVDIKLSYNPPVGALGHVVATIFGSDPKTEMDEDLVRMKTMIETGNPPHDASEPQVSETPSAQE